MRWSDTQVRARSEAPTSRHRVQLRVTREERLAPKLLATPSDEGRPQRATHGPSPPEPQEELSTAVPGRKMQQLPDCLGGCPQRRASPYPQTGRQQCTQGISSSPGQERLPREDSFPRGEPEQRPEAPDQLHPSAGEIKGEGLLSLTSEVGKWGNDTASGFSGPSADPSARTGEPSQDPDEGRQALTLGGEGRRCTTDPASFHQRQDSDRHSCSRCLDPRVRKG